MKIRIVRCNNRKRAFEVKTWRGIFDFPYSKADPSPSPINTVAEIYIDEDLGGEGFRYRLVSGSEGIVHIEQVLEYNKDPAYMRDLLLYKLTIEVQKRIEQSSLSKREIIRRLNTSPAQFYRLMDSTNYRKSIDKMLLLLSILDCDVDFSVKERSA